MSETSWYERMRLGFRKTSDRLGDNLTGLLSKSALDHATLDDIEEALVASDLGPRTAARVRTRLAEERFERGISTMRVGFAWSDSSRMSSSHGSFFARICMAICSITFDGDTW